MSPVGRLSLSRRVLYRWFHCDPTMLFNVHACVDICMCFAQLIRCTVHALLVLTRFQLLDNDEEKEKLEDFEILS